GLKASAMSPEWTRIVEAKKGWILYPPDKNLPGVTIHKTPSDWRAWKNMMSLLRRAGAPV
ncbi:MAG TPA: hypothetical protein PK681_12155, partial [Steroidobacteraceae bacterium]|nr:hypothetical protein [Steroidobacteraceae bacterium]